MPKLSVSVLAAAVSLSFLGAGCELVAQPHEALPAEAPAPAATTTIEVVAPAPAADLAPVPTPLTLTAISLDATSTGKMAGCAYSIDLPVVASGTSPEAAAAINADIESALRPASSTASGRDLVELLAKAYMEGCTKDIVETRKAFPRAASAEGWYMDKGVVVHANDGHLLSLEISEESFAGGAHPNHGSGFLLYDAQTGKRLRVGDILLKDKAEAYDKLEKQAVLAAAGPLLFPEDRARFASIASSTVPMTGEDLAKVAARDNFYLDMQGADVVIAWGPYEIAPYSAGDIEARIPFADLKGLIDPAGPAGYLIK